MYIQNIDYRFPKQLKSKITISLSGPIGDEPEDPDWNSESRVKKESHGEDDFDEEEDFRFDEEEEDDEDEDEVGLKAKKRGKKKRTRKDSISSQDKPKGAPTGNYEVQKRLFETLTSILTMKSQASQFFFA